MHRFVPHSKRAWLVLSAVLFLLVIALHCYLVWVGPFPGDRYAIAHFSEPWTEPRIVQNIGSFYQDLGTPVVAILFGLAAASVLWRFEQPSTLIGLAVACLGSAVNALLKLIFGPTPLWVASYHGGLNYPSGHVTFVTAAIGYLAVVAWRRRQHWAALLGLLFIIGVGPARVTSGAHLVSDAIAGYLLGASFVILATLAADHPLSGAWSARVRTVRAPTR